MEFQLTEQIYKDLMSLVPSQIRNYVGLDGLRVSFNEDLSSELTIKEIEDLYQKLNQPFIFDHKDYGNLIEALEALVASEDFVVVDDMGSMVEITLLLKGLKELSTILTNTISYIQQNQDNRQALLGAFALLQNDAVANVLMGSDVMDSNELDDISVKLIEGTYTPENVIGLIKEKFLEVGNTKFLSYQEYTLNKFQRLFDPRKVNPSEILDMVLYMVPESKTQKQVKAG